MKIGVSTFAWTTRLGRAQLDMLPKIKEMGLDGFEISMFDPTILPAVEIRRAFESSGLECTVCAILPSDINPISPDAAVRQRSRRHLVRCVESAAACGATLIGGPLYAPIGFLPPHRPTLDQWAWAVEAFQSLGEVLDTEQITLSIEPVNRSETLFLRTAAKARQLCEDIGHSRIGVSIDTYHANIEERSIVDAIYSLGPYLKHLHASENDRGLLGKGHVDFPSIVSALKSIGYGGYLTIEGFGYVPEDDTAPGYLLADINVSPEQLVRKGVEYLRPLIEDCFSLPGAVGRADESDTVRVR